MSKNIYIAGPMRGHKYYNFPAFDEAAKALHEKGWNPISPANTDRQFGFDPFKLPEDHNWDQFPDNHIDFKMVVQRVINALMQCQAIFVLNGSHASRGAIAERSVASWLGLEEFRSFELVPDLRTPAKDEFLELRYYQGGNLTSEHVPAEDVMDRLKTLGEYGIHKVEVCR